MTDYQVLKHYPSWREAVRAAGLEPQSTNVAISPEVLLEDWGEFVRGTRRIPTRDQYRRDGTYSPGVFEKRFGPWSALPAKFREFAGAKPEWIDVVALLSTNVEKWSRMNAEKLTTLRSGRGAAFGSAPPFVSSSDQAGLAVGV